jgi:hypothetical protein
MNSPDGSEVLSTTKWPQEESGQPGVCQSGVCQLPGAASQEKEGCGEAGLACLHEGALQGCVLLQGDHPEGRVL